MASPFQLLAQEEYKTNPKSGQKNPYGSPFYQLHDQENPEGFWKSAARTALQIPQGIAEATPPGIAAGLFQLGALGESDLDIDTWHKLRELAEQEGGQFDEEAYEQARQEMLGMIPTVSNIASYVEEETGLPLEPKTQGQKDLRFLSTASKLSPKDFTLRPLNTSLPRPILGTGVLGTKKTLKELGVPEPVSDIASFAILKKPTEGAGKISIGKNTKPSGLVERQFEGITKPTEVPANKIQKINDKLETDFRNISDKIIKESPIGETAENLAKDPTYKQASRELLEEAQQIADATPGTIPTKAIKKEYADVAVKNTKGFALDEFDKSYLKFMKEANESIIGKDVTNGQLVEMYRKNNRGLSEYYEPGSSKSLNRAKKQALLDQNRAIANLIEKSNPELSQVFKDGNQRWTKIMDAEAVDGFINEIFPEGGKINYRKLNDLFDKNGYDFIFKRALGNEGYKSFEQLTKDMLTSEAPYKMLRVAKEKGWGDLYNTAASYILHPKLGQAKLGLDTLKFGYRAAVNAMLDKPKFAITWKKAVNDLKKGNFKEAEKGFKTMDAEVEILPKEPSIAKSKQFEDIEAKVEPIEKPKQLEASKKEIEYKPKIEEKNIQIKTSKEGFRSRYSYIKEAENSKGDYLGGLGYDLEPTGELYISGIYVEPSLKRQGIGKKLFKDLLAEYPDKEIVISPLQPEGAEFFSKILGRKIKPQLTEDYVKIKGMSQEPIKLSKKDIEKAKENLGIEQTKKNLSNETPEISQEDLDFRDRFMSKQDLGSSERLDSMGKKEKTQTEKSKVKEKPKKEPIKSEIEIVKNNMNRQKKLYDERIKQLKNPDLSKAKRKILENEASNYNEGFILEKRRFEKLESLENMRKIENEIRSKFEKSKEKPDTSLTEIEVKEVKHQDISKKGLKEQKAWLIKQLDKAIEKAPEGYEDFGKKMKFGDKGEIQKAQRKAQTEKYELLTFEIPGDGIMKIRNHKKALEQFRNSVEKKWPDKPLKLSKKELYG